MFALFGLDEAETRAAGQVNQELHLNVTMN
jgi:hypothetical protein